MKNRATTTDERAMHSIEVVALEEAILRAWNKALLERQRSEETRSFPLFRRAFRALAGSWLFRRRIRRGLNTAGARLRAQGWSEEIVERVLAEVAARRAGNRTQLEAAVTDALDELAADAAERGERTTLGTPRDVASILTQLTATDRIAV